MVEGKESQLAPQEELGAELQMFLDQYREVLGRNMSVLMEGKKRKGGPSMDSMLERKMQAFKEGDPSAIKDVLTRAIEKSQGDPEDQEWAEAAGKAQELLGRMEQIEK